MLQVCLHSRLLWCTTYCYIKSAKIRDQSKLKSKTKLQYIGSLVWLSFFLKCKYCFTHQNPSNASKLNLQMNTLCTYTLVRGFNLKDIGLLKMLKLQWMLLVWCQCDWKQVISPSILAENRGRHAKSVSFLKCCIAACVRLPRAVWLLYSVVMGDEKISRRAVDADVTQTQDVCPGC